MLQEKFIKPKITCDQRGVISTGIKVTNDKGVEYPKSVDYFVVDSFEEIKALYGNEPRKLIILMPSDNLLDFYDCNMDLYRSDHQKVRTCDGETCTHKQDETLTFLPKPEDPEGKPRTRNFQQGQVTSCVCAYMPETVEKNGKQVKNPLLCGYTMYLKAFVANPKNGQQLTIQPVLFRTRSKNTGDTLYSELKRYPRYRNIPYELEVEMVNAQGKKFPVWRIRPYIDHESWLQYQLEAAEDSGFKMLGMGEDEIAAGGRMQEKDPLAPEGAHPLGKGEIHKPDSQNDSQSGFDGEGNFRGDDEHTPSAYGSHPSQEGNIQDAEFTEVKSKKAEVKNDENDPLGAKAPLPLGKGETSWPDTAAGYVIAIESYGELKELNRWWIMMDMKSKLAKMNSKDRNMVLDARDKQKAKLQGVEDKKNNAEDLPF